MNIFRIGGVIFLAGLALFLISMLAKLLIVAGLAFLALRVIGRQIARRFAHYGPPSVGQPYGPSTSIIAIDNPAGYRTPAYGQAPFGRVISIN
jgi:hypothetical protein